MNCLFEWDEQKNLINKDKHNISFYEAQFAFSDKDRVLLKDVEHSVFEKRFFCIAKINRGIVTVRFTYRNRKIRIFGAAFWRKGKKIYVKKQK